MRTVRITDLDAARGAAMVLVCLSHFTQVYLGSSASADGTVVPFLYDIGRVASPTFVAVSGIILGLLYAIKRDQFATLRVKLVDRGLFLLTIGHVLIACSRLEYQVKTFDALRMTFMTDAIGVCVVLGALLITRTSRAVRGVLGILCFGTACLLVRVWMPDDTVGLLVKEVFVGGEHLRVLSYSVPILPWFGVYLACTPLGEYLGECYRRQNTVAVERVLFLVGTASVGLALCAHRLARIAAITQMSDTSLAAYWTMLLSPWSKLPPGPDYVLFFGGVGLLMMWAVTYANGRSLFPWVLGQAATLGRCSLAVFTLQFYLFYTVLYAMHLPATRLWPLIFVACMAPLFIFAQWWDRHDLNRLLTVGAQRLLWIDLRPTGADAMRGSEVR